MVARDSDKEGSMTVENNKQIAERAFLAMMSGNLGSLRDLIAAGAVLHQCGFLDPIPAEIIASGEFAFQSRLRDRHVRIERMVGEGDLVAIHWSTSGELNEPESPGIDGKVVSFPSMSFLRLRDGKIAEVWNIQDISTLEMQMGDPGSSSDG
jgi:ketosteroid isomerase-like protein